MIRDIVYNFETKHKEGFVNSELEDLLKLFPETNRENFIKSFISNTCMIIDDEFVHYHEDVYYALLNCIKQH